MSYISEKVSYLDGLADGMEIEKDPNGKLLKGIIEALGAIAEQMEEQDEVVDDLSDCIDDIYDELDECFEDDDDDDDDDDEFNEDDFIEVDCPHCGETIYFDENMIDSEDGLICPCCNESIEFKVPTCDCGCHSDKE
ncbi:MAG: hypothetical protein RRZ24_06415 [Clostridia bacterium]